MTLTSFWHRRICEAVILVSLVILALYGWAYAAGISTGVLASGPAAIMAAVSLVSGVASYLWAPKHFTFWASFGSFALLCAAIAVLIVGTGGITSPFIALWMVASVFAGAFGAALGILPLLFVTLGYLALEYFGGTLTRETVITVVLAGELPLAVSYLIWHNRSESGKEEVSGGGTSTYSQLASELSQATGKSEVVINAIADGVIALNGQGVIQLINPAAQQITGWNRQDAVSLDYKSILKLLDKSERELTPATDPIAQVLGSNKEVTNNDLTLVTNSGKKRLVSLIVSPVGQPGEGVIIVFRDITLEKREERQQAEFISTAAHEMRTPVASIEGYLGLALNPATAQIDEKARDFITKAHESAQHLGNLFQDLLDVSKAEDGRLTNNPKVVDVVAFTHDIVEGLRIKAEEKGLRLLFKPQPGDEDEKAGERRLNPVYYAHVDNDHLREVIANLVENAIKYTPSGEVVIDINGSGDNVQITVADSGIGIPKEDQAHLFQKFYRVDNSDTREIGGTGLGLYLCRRLVETMSGRIWVESEYKKGSTFFVEIPRIDHEEATRMIESASIEQPEEPAIIPDSQELPLPEQPQAAAEPTPAPAPQPQLPPQPAAPAFQQPQPAAPSGSDETVYTNAPVETVVQQLQASGNAVVRPQPQPQQQYPQQQQYQQPSYQPPQAPIRENTPLTSIEQNPAQYMRRPDGGMNIPPRQ